MITLSHADVDTQVSYSDWADALPTERRASVMVALNRGYVESLEIEATMEAMRFHQRECRAWYRTANIVEMIIGFETAMGNRWGVSK